MQHTNLTKTLSVFVCIALIAALALTAVGCNSADEAVKLTEKTFTLVVVDTYGNETSKTITTNKPTVGEVLTALDIIEGEPGRYGLYIKSVNGITVDFDTDGQYWAFYVDGEYASKGVDKTTIVDGATYMLKVEK